MRIGILLILLLFLSGCALFEVAPEEEDMEELDVEEFLEEEPETLGELVGIEDNEAEEQQEEEPEEPDVDEARIDVVLDEDAGTATAKGVFYGESVDESFDYTDIDAIIFELHTTLGTTLDLTRMAVYVDDEPYLKPSQTPAVQQIVAEQKEKRTDFSAIPIIYEKEDGLIRGIGCELNKGLLRIVFHNEEENAVPFYQQVIPKIDGALVTYLNKKMIYPLYCEDDAEVIGVNSSLECIKAGVFFVQEGRLSRFGDNEIQFDPNEQDQLIISRPGFKEEVKFFCNVTIAPVDQTNST